MTLSGTADAEALWEDQLQSKLKTMIQDVGLPTAAANRLFVFISNGCLPFPQQADEAIGNLIAATKAVRELDGQRSIDPRRLKRFDDIIRSFVGLRSLMDTLRSMDIVPQADKNNERRPSTTMRVSLPHAIYLDLGLRQKRRHYSQFYFQAIVLPQTSAKIPSKGSFAKDSPPKDHGGHGAKIAEGGRYDDLVRRYRPPGNFGSALFTFYTNTPIPSVRNHTHVLNPIGLYECICGPFLTQSFAVCHVLPPQFDSCRQSRQ